MEKVLSGPLILDQPSDQIDAELTNRVLEHGRRSATTRLSTLVDANVRGRLGTASVECDPQAAGELLRVSIRAVTTELGVWANSDPALRWLWFIRRLPTRMFSGALPTTFGYDRTLGEVISGHSVAGASQIPGDGASLSYPIAQAGLARVVRFCEGVRFLSNLHGRYRWASKGALIRFKKGSQPSEMPTHEVRTAVEAYDRRVATSESFLGRLGSHFASPLDKHDPLSILCVHAITPMMVPTVTPGTHVSQIDASTIGHTRGSFLPRYVQLEKLQRLLLDPRSDPSLIFTRESAALIYLLACAPILMSRHFAGFHSLIRTGYLVWTKNRTPTTTLVELFDEMPSFVREIATIAGLANASDVIGVLEQMRGVAWPLAAGPIVRREGDATCIDFAAATLRLSSSLTFPAIQGRYANARADHFEEEVQALLDHSDWAPRERIRQQARITLTRNARALTDIDAIGEMGSKLLLVSCKSLVYSDEYDIGDYSAVRNAASTAKEAVDRWTEVLDDLRGHPVGDNYDFRDAEAVLGVVCTPQAVYVEKNVLEKQAAEGLRMLVSFGELAKWSRSSWSDLDLR